MTGSPTPLVVLDVAGLTPRLLAHMPQLAAITETGGWRAELGTVLPAVTCSAQATLLTGTLPREHGIVGNGWYFRGLGEVLLWRQHNALMGGDKLWDAARRAHRRQFPPPAAVAHAMSPARFPDHAAAAYQPRACDRCKGL